jgi:hypothetical protein
LYDEHISLFSSGHNCSSSIFYGYTAVIIEGIGSGASRALVEGIADESNGSFEMIDDQDARAGKVVEKVLRLLASISKPSLARTTLNWAVPLVEKTALRGQVSRYRVRVSTYHHLLIFIVTVTTCL